MASGVIFLCGIILFFLIFNPLLETQESIDNRQNGFLKNLYQGPIPEIIEEAVLEPTHLINKYGYPAENRTVTTTDNYVLTTHRIPYGKNGKENKTRIPILLMHGMNCESTQWIDSGPKSLAFVLADGGYDVWIGNFRGGKNTHHTTYSRETKEFWDFSVEDHALKDLPALIDDVLKTTNYSRLFYIGQSMGTTTMFIMLSEKPEYNDKLAAYIALTPVAHGRYATAFLARFASNHLKIFTKLNSLLGSRSVLTSTPTADKITLRFCPSSDPFLCEIGMHMTAGFNPYLHNTSRIPIYAVHCSAGTSTKNMLHFGQLIAGKQPRKFNYGSEENIARYGSVEPPAFNISRVTVPTVIFYCANDASATPLDVTLLKRQLPKVVGFELFPNPMAVHTDIGWATNAKELVFDKIIVYLRKLWNGTEFDQ